MKLLDGKQVAENILARLAEEIRASGVHPALGVLLVGDDAASHLYVSLKEKAAARLGIRVEKKCLFESVPLSDVERVIDGFNRDENIHGVLIQLPLPAHLPMEDIMKKIDPKKDVDGFHPDNERKFLAGEEAFFPVFPHALLEMLLASGEPIEGKKAVILGNSWRFGSVMSAVLTAKGVRAEHIPCTECASEQGLREMKSADIVISACGKERTITGIMLKSGAIVLDGGIVKKELRVVGDVDQASVADLEGWLSPVPGGVGPVTIACLLSNVVEAAKRHRRGA